MESNQNNPMRNWLVGVLVVIGLINLISYFNYGRYFAGSLFFVQTILLATLVGLNYGKSRKSLSKTHRSIEVLLFVIVIAVSVVGFIFAAKI